MSAFKKMGDLKKLSFKDITENLIIEAFPKLFDAITAASNANGGWISSLGAGFKSILSSINPVIFGITAITAAVLALSKAYVSAFESNELMRDSYSSYQDAQTNLDSINSELESTKASIDELNAKDHLTFVEQSELEKLKETTEQLQIQASLAEQNVNKEARKAAEDTLKAYKKNFKEDIDEESTSKKQEYIKTSGNTVGFLSDKSDISGQIAVLKQYEKFEKEAISEFNKAKKEKNESDMEWWGEEVALYNEGSQEIKNTIFDQISLLQEYRNVLSQLPESELKKISGASELLEQLDKQIAYAYNEIDPSGWEKIKLAGIFENENFSDAKNELVEIAKASKGVGVTVDEVKKKYPELADSIESAGLSIKDFVNGINENIDFTESTTDTIDQKISSIRDSFKKVNPSEELNDFDKWIDSLSKGEKEIVYSISFDTDTSEWKLQDWQNAFDDAVKLTDTQLSNIKEKFKDNSITEWFDSLSPEDKKFVYEIGLKSDDTTLYTLTRWKTELQSMKETGQTTGEQMQQFYDIMNDAGEGNLSEYIDGYTSKISSLQDILSKINTGDFSKSDKLDLATNFPELAPYINDTDALKNAIQELINTFNQDMNTKIDETIENLSESAPEAAAALESLKEAMNDLNNVDSGWDFDIDAEVEKFDNLFGAMKESVSGTGLSTNAIDSIKNMFQGLDGYDPSVLFERTEHGIHLNTTALRALQSQYEAVQKLDIQEKLQSLKQEYDESAKAIEGLTDAQAKNILGQKGLRSTDAILEDIANVQTLAAQYEGLTSAYNKWIMAQSSGEEGDMYDGVTGSLEEINGLYEQGLVGTNAFRAAVQMMTDEDLSTASIDKLISVYEAGYPAMQRYFTEGQEGCERFLQDVQSINTEWAHMNENGDWEIDFGIGNDAEIAQAITDMTGLQVSTEEVQMIMRKMADFGFDIKLDSAYTSVDELKSRIEETENTLEKLGQEPVDIKIDFDAKPENIETMENEVEKAKNLIEEINNSDLSPEVKTALLDDANAKLDMLISKIVQASEPSFMQLSTSDVDSSLASVLTLCQQYQQAVEKERVLTLRGDTSGLEEAHAEAEALAQELAALDDETLVKIGINVEGADAETRVESIKTQIDNNKVIFKVDSDTSQATTEVQTLEDKVQNLEDKDVSISIDVLGDDALDNLKNALKNINDKNIKVNVEVSDDWQNIKKLSDSLKNVESKQATATVKTTGKEDVVALSQAVEKITNKNVTATVNSVGKEDAIALSDAIKDLTDKTVTAIAETTGKEDVDALKASIDSLYDRTVVETAKVVGTNLVIALKSAIDSLYSKTVSAGANVFGTSAVWSLKSAIDSLYNKTVTATTITKKVAGVDGTAHVDGTTHINGSAYINGTAFVKGDWGTKESGVALGGELGQELIVRDGHFFTIGDDSAEFFKYQKGDIIFNAEQTKQIFEKGKITYGRKRGNALVEGTAFSSGSGKFHGSGGSLNNSGSSGNYNSGGNNYVQSSNQSQSSHSQEEKEYKETLDWIEMKLNRIERVASNLDIKAKSIYRSWTSRHSNILGEIEQLNKQIVVQQQAYNRYIEQVNSVGLDEEWARKVRDGMVDISTITDETLHNQIQEYQEWFDKVLDCRDAIDSLKEAQSELYSTAFQTVSAKYEGILAIVKHEQSMLEEYISQSEEKGYITSIKYYEALMDNQRNQISKLQVERAMLTEKMDVAVNSGSIKKYSEEWNNMVQQIDEVTLAIEQGNTELIKYGNSIRDIKWQIFDLIQERISGVTTEAQFLIDLLSSKELFTDKGQLTNEGKSTMGLHAANYNVYMSQADDYAKEMQEINKQLANDPANLDLAKRRQELLELQQEMILAAEDEKEAIVDMVKEGIELELDALKDLIDKYEEALDAQKDMYDYQNKIKDKTSEVASLEKQMAAYSGDTSEETKVTVQKIKVSLEKAKKDLEDMQYDKYISDQKKLLDELYNDYETILNMRLDDIDKLISDMIQAVNDNSGIIADTIYSAASDVGYTLSESMDSIWKDAFTDSQKDGQKRVSQTTSLLKQLVSNGEISGDEADGILTALGSGDAEQAKQALEQIQQLTANGKITQETANKIIAALSLGNQQQTYNALNIVNKLKENGKMSSIEAKNIIAALVTGDAAAIQNAQNIINRLAENGFLAQEDAGNIIQALIDSASTNRDVVTTYGDDFSNKITTTNETLASIKAVIQSILSKIDSQASANIDTAHNSSAAYPSTNSNKKEPAKTQSTQKPTNSNTSKPSSSTTSSSPNKTEKEKYGVALAIINGNYGWGTGNTASNRLSSKGFNAAEIQNLIDKLVSEGYVRNGSWVGKYQGITDLSPYHFNKFAKGIKNLNKDQLGITQENGVEYINSPTLGMLTPLTKGSDIFNATASENLWNVANNPEQYMRDSLGLKRDISNVSNLGGNVTSNITINFENITLPNVTNYKEFVYRLQHDKSFEKMVKAMTTDRLFGGSSIKKYRY